MKPLKCPKCNSSFNEQFMLNDHMKNVHSEKKLHCKKCDYKTNKNSHLKRHIVTHESIKDFPAKKVLHCKKCDYETNRNSNLKRHMLTHKTNVELPTKKVKSKQYIQSEKNIPCRQCDYKTNKNSNLKRHIKTHEVKEEPPAKKIKCDQCSQIFSEQFNLNKHVKNVHGEEMNCPHCNFKTKIQQTFTNHVNKCKKKVEIARKDKTSVQTPLDQVEVACDEQEQCLEVF